jgi:hypothetical protein
MPEQSVSVVKETTTPITSPLKDKSTTQEQPTKQQRQSTPAKMTSTAAPQPFFHANLSRLHTGAFSAEEANTIAAAVSAARTATALALPPPAKSFKATTEPQAATPAVEGSAGPSKTPSPMRTPRNRGAASTAAAGPTEKTTATPAATTPGKSASPPSKAQSGTTTPIPRPRPLPSGLPAMTQASSSSSQPATRQPAMPRSAGPYYPTWAPSGWVSTQPPVYAPLPHSAHWPTSFPYYLPQSPPMALPCLSGQPVYHSEPRSSQLVWDRVNPEIVKRLNEQAATDTGLATIIRSIARNQASREDLNTLYLALATIQHQLEQEAPAPLLRLDRTMQAWSSHTHPRLPPLSSLVGRSEAGSSIQPRRFSHNSSSQVSAPHTPSRKRKSSDPHPARQEAPQRSRQDERAVASPTQTAPETSSRGKTLYDVQDLLSVVVAPDSISSSSRESACRRIAQCLSAQSHYLARMRTSASNGVQRDHTPLSATSSARPASSSQGPSGASPNLLAQPLTSQGDQAGTLVPNPRRGFLITFDTLLGVLPILCSLQPSTVAVRLSLHAVNAPDPIRVVLAFGQESSAFYPTSNERLAASASPSNQPSTPTVLFLECSLKKSFPDRRRFLGHYEPAELLTGVAGGSNQSNGHAAQTNGSPTAALWSSRSTDGEESPVGSLSNGVHRIFRLVSVDRQAFWASTTSALQAGSSNATIERTDREEECTLWNPSKEDLIEELALLGVQLDD